MKNSILSVVMLSCVALLSACGLTGMDNTENERHFITWNSYLGYSVDETPRMDLTYIATNENEIEKEDICEVSLISDAGEIKAKSFDVFEGSGGSGYLLMTISIALPRLDAGTYHISGVKITENEKAVKTYDIGIWTIDVRAEISSDIAYERCSFLNSVFADYYSEIVNESDTMITVLGLSFDLENKQPQIIITESENLETGTTLGTRIIPPGRMKFFNFRFADAEGNPILAEEFIALKPFLIYEKDGKEVYASMNTTIYSPSYEESDILKIIH